MTSDRLYEILSFIDSLDQTLNLQSTLETLRDTLANLANSPANTGLQK